MERALFLANLWGASCTLLFVADDEKPKNVLKRKMEDVQSYLEGLVVDSPAWADIQPEILVKAGNIYEVINNVAQERRSRIIVMGTYRKNILHVFKGTTVERVLHTGKTPVLMVNKPVDNGYDSVVFGIIDDLCARQAIDSAISFGLVNDAGMTAVHAYQDLAKTQMNYAGVEPSEIMRHEGECHNKLVDEIYDFIASTKLGDQNYRLVLEETDPAQLIIKVAGDLDTDLIVIGTRRVSDLKKVELGSVAESVLRHAYGDVLVVPPQL